MCLDSVHFIVGLVSWLMALFGFIVDEIFALADVFEDEGRYSSNLLDLINQKGNFCYHVRWTDEAY